MLVLDLSAAFDEVDHNCFLVWHKSDLGFSESTKMWLESYIRDRYQSMYIKPPSARLPLMTYFPLLTQLWHDWKNV